MPMHLIVVLALCLTVIIIVVLVRPSLADFERFWFRKFLKRLKRTTWSPSADGLIIQNRPPKWPIISAYVRLGDRPPYKWPYIDHAEKGTYFSLGSKDDQAEPPFVFYGLLSRHEQRTMAGFC